jgi:hypothetical protein
MVLAGALVGAMTAVVLSLRSSVVQPAAAASDVPELADRV